jgi:hypothetical protein
MPLYIRPLSPEEHLAFVAARPSVYSFRGITDSLEESNHLLGLLRFKVGAGGEAVEYLGEWDFPRNRLLHRALWVPSYGWRSPRHRGQSYNGFTHMTRSTIVNLLVQHDGRNPSRPLEAP